jgi:hypothetical protein
MVADGTSCQAVILVIFTQDSRFKTRKMCFIGKIFVSRVVIPWEKKNREISEQNLKKFNTPRWFPSSPFASIARLRPPIPSPGLHGDRGIF